MIQRKHIFLLMCVAMLAPSIVTAQSFFAKQKVAVWEVFDRNNDVSLATSTKTTIRTNIEEAFTNSKHYEYYSYSISEVKAALVQQGITRPTLFDIAKKIRDMSVSKGAEVDYVIFSFVKVKMHSNSYDEFVVNLSSELFSTTTFKCEKMADVDMLSNPNAIPAACSELLSALLGERLYVTTTNQPSYQQPAYSQPSQSSYSKTYKVGDYYDANGKQGVVFAVTPDGKRGKIVGLNNLGLMLMPWDNAIAACRNLGNGWRLPSREELLAIYKVKSTLNSTLAAVGDELTSTGGPEGWYWSSIECSSDRAWNVSMNNGNTEHNPKDINLSVRAVSAF